MHRAGVQWKFREWKGWLEAQKVADGISADIFDKFGQRVLSHFSRNLNEVYIVCDDFNTAATLSGQLQKIILEKFGLLCERQVDTMYIDALLSEYQEAVGKAIKDLKVTKFWRIAKIIRGLKKVYENPGPTLAKMPF